MMMSDTTASVRRLMPVDRTRVRNGLIDHYVLAFARERKLSGKGPHPELVDEVVRTLMAAMRKCKEGE